MHQVNVHEAKTHLSKLIDQAERGEEVVIARAGKPVVRLIPVSPSSRGRYFGVLKGRARVDEAFFDPLSEQELGAWE